MGWLLSVKKTKEQLISQSEPRSRDSGLVLPNPESLEHKLPQCALISAKEEINDTDYVSQLPKDMILKIFSYLSAIELARCDRVCKTWKRLATDETLLKAFDSRNLSSLLSVFDESDWDKYVDMSAYGLTTEDIPLLDKRKEITLLGRVLSSPIMEEIEGNAGVTELIIPKGLTFNKLVKLALSPKMGNRVQFRSASHDISEELGDILVDKTYRIVITKNVFKKSRNLSFLDQKTLVRNQALVTGIGCEMLRALEAIVLLVVTLMGSGERLYNTPTRCSDRFGGYQSFVDNFSSGDIRVDICNGGVASDFVGVGGVLLKF